MGIPINNFIRRLYPCYVVQLGTIMIAVATTKLCNTFPITAKGENAYKGLSCHDIEKALICMAPVSEWYETGS